MAVPGILSACLSPLILACLVVPVQSLGSWGQSGPITVSQSQVVTVTCTVSDLEPFTPARIVKQTNGVKVVLTEDAIVQSPFSLLNRFRVGYQRQVNSGIITLTIDGAQGEDSGEYLCMMYEDYSGASSLHLDVTVPIQRVWMMALGPDDSESPVAMGSHILLRQGEEHGVECLASADGTYRAPQLIAYIDGNDATSEFARSDESRRRPAVQGNTAQPYDIITMITKLRYVTLSPVLDYHLKNITCVGSMPDFPAMSSNALFNIEYGPVITCPKYMHHGQLGQRVTMTCVIRSNPGSSVNLKYGDTEEHAVEATSDAGISFNKEAITADRVEISIVIDTLTSDHFTNYYLSALNDINERNIILVLNQGAPSATKSTEVVVPPENNDPGYQDPRELKDTGNMSSRLSPLAGYSTLVIVIATWRTFTHS